MPRQLITYNSEVTELVFMFRTEQLTQKPIHFKYHLHTTLAASSKDNGVVEAQPSREAPTCRAEKTRGNCQAMCSRGFLRVGIAHRKEGKDKKGRAWKPQLPRNLHSWTTLLSGPASSRRPIWLPASLSTSPSSLSATEPLRLLLGSNPMLRNPRNAVRWIAWEWHRHGCWSWWRQAAGWEESWLAEPYCSHLPCLARLALCGALTSDLESC